MKGYEKDMGFRYKPAVRVGYVRQGYIYFKSLSYPKLTSAERHRIREHCKASGGEYRQALFEFVTTQNTATEICMRHYIASKTTLYQMTKEYYESFPEDL